MRGVAESHSVIQARPQITSPAPSCPATISPADITARDARDSWPWQPGRHQKQAPTPSSPERLKDANIHRPDAHDSNAQSPLFLGATSYSSIFYEHLGTSNSAPRLNDTSRCSRHSAQAVRGSEALAFLQQREAISRILQKWYEPGHSTSACPEPIMAEWMRQLWDHYGDLLTAQQPADLQALCETLWTNTQQPLPSPPSSAQAWASSMTGASIRWEVVGLIAITTALCVLCLDASDPVLAELKWTRSIPAALAEASEACLSFCRACNNLSDAFIWLLHDHGRLVASLHGAGSYAAYRAGGETNDAIIAMGLHQPTADSTPFFLRELRRRLVANAYAKEVATAAFLGRPVRLPSSFLELDSPLDLRDSEVVMQGTQLDDALAALDTRGFSQLGLSRVAWLKVWLCFGPQWEEVLELSLARHHTPAYVAERAAAIRRLNDEQWTAMPASYRAIRDRPASDLATMVPARAALFQAVIRHEMQSHELLLQRVLVLRTGSSADGLLRAAQACLADVLAVTQRHDIAALFEVDYAMLLVGYGLRSAVVLAVELLKQEVSSEVSLLPRSRTVQDLAVFAARLGAVDASRGTAGMCDHGSRVITYILDRVLGNDTGNGRDVQRARLSVSPAFAYGQPTPRPTLEMDDSQRWRSDSQGALAHVDPGDDVDLDFSEFLDSIDWGSLDRWVGLNA